MKFQRFNWKLISGSFSKRNEYISLRFFRLGKKFFPETGEKIAAAARKKENNATCYGHDTKTFAFKRNRSTSHIVRVSKIFKTFSITSRHELLDDRLLIMGTSLNPTRGEASYKLTSILASKVTREIDEMGARVITLVTIHYWASLLEPSQKPIKLKAAPQYHSREPRDFNLPS